MGTPKTPTAILKLRGSWRAKLRDDEPEVKSGVGSRPAWLPEASWIFWDKAVTDLTACGILAIVDTESLACLAYARVRLEEAIKLADGTGSYERRIDNTFDRYTRMLQRFGLDPVSRASVKVVKPAPGANRPDAEDSELKLG